MDKFEDLQVFVTVVDEGSFTAASARLDLAKSAISRRVANLEERLGVQLIRRTTRRLNLTDTGRSFYEHSARILADLEEAESAATQAHGELRGLLRVALPLSFGLRHMGPPIADFSRLHPQVEFEFDLNDRRVDLLGEGMDVAIRIGHMADSSLIARRLFTAGTVVCGAPDYFERHGRPERPEELLKHRCLVYGNLADPGTWTYRDTDGSEHQISPQIAMTANNGDFLCAAAVAGLGLVMQPAFIACDAVRRGELSSILTGYAWPATPAYAVYPPARHLSYRVRAFIDFLVDYFSGTPSWDEACYSND